MLLPRLPMASSGDEARAAVRVGTCTKAEAADPSGVAATAAACGTMLKKIDHMTTSGETPEYGSLCAESGGLTKQIGEERHNRLSIVSQPMFMVRYQVSHSFTMRARPTF